MDTEQLFIYQWHYEEEENSTIIRIFGLNKANQSVYVYITDFTPYIYLELPTDIKWTQAKAQMVCNYFDSNLQYGKPLKKTLVEKKRLYYAHKEIDEKGNYRDKLFPYLFMSFATPTDIKKFSYFIRKNIRIPGLGEMKFKIHESDANPILQLICLRNIYSAGWIKIKGTKISDDEKDSVCDLEYYCKYKNIDRVDLDIIPNPLIMGMDIEVNSSNPNAMPDANKVNDKIFQIACVFARGGESEDRWKKVILSLGNPDSETTGTEVEIRSFRTEGELLEGYTDLILEKNPQIIVGYNIFMFDIPYMMDRAKFNYSFRFNQQGYLHGKQGKEKMIKWSSSAYGTQEFKFLDCEGRLFVDLLPLIKRDYKFDTYSLKAVSTSFLGQTKDPLTVKGIFKCYRLGTPKSLGICAKYCVQDSNLTVKLFEKLQYWIGLCEMAKTCNIPIFYTYTQGQQIKIFSQVYKKCMYDNYVVEKDGYIAKEDERYTGAYVFNPEPGLYDMIVSFDFSSLYPTTIIAYNIDYTTLVNDESIPDEKCNIFHWTDHQGCPHDKTVRKTKIKKEDVMCAERKFRFLKEPKGVIPTLLENLLGARKTTNKQISKLEERLSTEKLTDEEKTEIKSLITVLDKRQLAYKVSANSMYGAMGTRRGYLPFLPGAMCTTARGRESIEKAAKHLQEIHKAHLVYGDTDSTYIHFNHINNARDLWNYALEVQDEVSSLFPRPMKLAFEEKIYWRYFILSKKRYMALKCDLDEKVIRTKNKETGELEDDIFKRGVLLARRDNSKFVQGLYKDLIMKIFYRHEKNNVLNFVIDKINELFYYTFPSKSFIITKSIGDMDDYKIRPLPEDEKKRAKRLEDLDCTEEEYRIKSLPAHIQLAEKMKRRGKRVDVGTRLEYLVTMNGGWDGKLFDKIEELEYFKDHSDILRIDFLYYLKNAINPVDEAIKVAYGLEKFVERQYKLRIIKHKICLKIEKAGRSRLKFIE